uniref:Uncharacterized protein n=1 Tax=Biomphalaria glabrata TaxID=6526 RepID=A0A2C9L7J5_BIOGL
MSAHQIIADLELVTFDQNKKVMPQVTELAENILYVLDEILSLMNSVLLVEREPPVSALNMSREQTIKSVPPPMETQFNSPTLEMMKEGVEAIRESSSVENEKLRQLQEQYQQLKEDMEQERKIHQDQIQKNTVVMMELQETINDLQRELSSLGKAPLRTKSDLSSGRGTAVIHKSPSPESSVLFTRLDSERNAKIMRKAVIEDKLNPERYKEAIAKMDKYVSLPAQRLAHLVKKYVHHCRMKKIEENVKNGGELDDEVYEVLNKMENLQNQHNPLNTHIQEQDCCWTLWKGTSLLEHPLLKEFLKVFNGLMEFKDGVGKLLLDKGLNVTDYIGTPVDTQHALLHLPDYLLNEGLVRTPLDGRWVYDTWAL